MAIKQVLRLNGLLCAVGNNTVGVVAYNYDSVLYKYKRHKGKRQDTIFREIDWLKDKTCFVLF